MKIIKGGKLIKEEQYREKRKHLRDIFEKCFYENYYLLEDKKKACYYGLRFFNLNDTNTKTSIIDIRNMIKRNVDFTISKNFYIKNIDKYVLNGEILTLNKNINRFYRHS